MRYRIVVFGLMIACGAFAQDRFVFPTPDPSSIVAKKDNVYRAALKFDLYRPASESVVPVVIFANIGSLAYTSWPGYIVGDRLEEALRELERAWDLGRHGAMDTAYPAAKAAAGFSNIARAVHWLEVVLSTPFGPKLDELQTNEAFSKVRDTPEFRELLAKYDKR
jgi:hypothetical protein